MPVRRLCGNFCFSFVVAALKGKGYFKNYERQNYYLAGTHVILPYLLPQEKANVQ